MEYLRKMMIEHPRVTLAEWLANTPHLDPAEVTAIYQDLKDNPPSTSEVINASKW